MADPVATNVIVGGAKLYFAPVGEAIPDETDIAFDEAWGGNWARVGYTKAPLTMIYEFDEMDVEVEEHLAAIERIKIAERLTLETTLAEFVGSYLALGAGVNPADVTTTPAGAAQVGFEEFGIGDQYVLDKYAVGFEGRYVNATGDSYPVRIFVHKATMRFNGNLEFSNRSGAYPGIPLQVKALADLTQAAGERLFKYQRVTAPATV